MIQSVTILGCGALGLYYGSQLHKSGAQVKFLLRSDYDQIKKEGIFVNSVGGDYHFHPPFAFKTMEEVKNSDLILICLKTTGNEYILETLPQITGPQSLILTLQNGLGNEEAIEKALPNHSIFGGVAFICANRTSPGKVSHTAFGHIKANPFSSQATSTQIEKIKALFEKAQIDFHTDAPLDKLKWEKLVWNVPFNGLSASLGGVDTEKILSVPKTQELVRLLMEEVLQGAESNEIRLPSSIIQDNIDKTLRMGPYLTSMCLDFREKRLLEAESIIGEPLRRAQKNGVQLPYMDYLYRQLFFYNQSLS